MAWTSGSLCSRSRPLPDRAVLYCFGLFCGTCPVDGSEESLRPAQPLSESQVQAVRPSLFAISTLCIDVHSTHKLIAAEARPLATSDRLPNDSVQLCKVRQLDLDEPDSPLLRHRIYRAHYRWPSSARDRGSLIPRGCARIDSSPDLAQKRTGSADSHRRRGGCIDGKVGDRPRRSHGHPRPLPILLRCRSTCSTSSLLFKRSGDLYGYDALTMRDAAAPLRCRFYGIGDPGVLTFLYLFLDRCRPLEMVQIPVDPASATRAFLHRLAQLPRLHEVQWDETEDLFGDLLFPRHWSPGPICHQVTDLHLEVADAVSGNGSLSTLFPSLRTLQLTDIGFESHECFWKLTAQIP